MSTVTPLTAREVETRNAYPHLFADDVARRFRNHQSHGASPFQAIHAARIDSAIERNFWRFAIELLDPSDGYHGAELPR